MNWLAIAPLLALLGVLLAPVVAQAWASVIKRHENGALRATNVALREIDIGEENKKHMLRDNDRLRAETDKLRGRIEVLETKELAGRKSELEYQAIFLAMETDLNALVGELLAFRQTAELRSVEALARSLQVSVNMGRQIAKAG